MDDPIVFDTVPIQIPTDAIYRRLGYRRASTRLSDEQKEKVEQAIEYGMSLVRLQGTYLRIPIQEKKTGHVSLLTGVVLESRNLAHLLKGSCEIIMMASTAGSHIIDAIQADADEGNLARAVVLDALASEMTDGALDWIVERLNREFRRENKRLTRRRFSAGYGDFALENQRYIHSALRLKSLGISITEYFILIPEKSVTAVCGLEHFL
ncbi:MAG: methionine synthase [Candidatus Omnitrophica bacterium]|nr:methionine synthase [Candidatus Omnitrophota bacterium]